MKIFSCPLAAMTYSQNYQNHGYVQLIFTQRYGPCKPIDSSCCIFLSILRHVSTKANLSLTNYVVK